MEYCKFIFIFIILFLGTVGQRFHRHLSNENQNEFGNAQFNNLIPDKHGELLSSDDSFDINTVSDVPLEFELLHDELKFQMCSYNCDDDIVILCFDSDEPNTVQIQSNQCGSNQCTFQAGFSVDRSGKIMAKFSEKYSGEAFVFSSFRHSKCIF
uniref:CUB domain-containing protein n=1 Tax=Panagrolaimus superbus TaxID=310955 RepID=A0A914Z3E1_9BILA